MKYYNIIVTADAREALLRYSDYLLEEKKSPQAAKNLILDFKETRKKLENTAGSLREPDSEELKHRGLKRINLLKHNYFLLYKIVGDNVFITNMFHSLEDFENKLR